MLLKDLIPLIRPESVKIELRNQNHIHIAELYPYQLQEKFEFADCEVLEVWVKNKSQEAAINIQYSDDYIPKKVEMGADPKEYRDFELKEYLLDSGVPKSDVKTKDSHLLIPATKINKKLLDKWNYQHRERMCSVRIDPETKIPVYEIYCYWL